MIDLHFHCLPAIDDGPREWDDAVALCRAAEGEGTTTIVATPHVLRDPWLNETAADRDELILKLNTLLGGSPAILPGCEYYLSSGAVDLWKGKGGPLVGLNRSRYLLVEFPVTTLPSNAEALIHELVVEGVVPLLAHPERNLVIMRDVTILERFVALGARVQLTAGSLLGDFGDTVQQACESCFDRDLVHVVASDAHSIARRPPRLAAAKTWVAERWSKEAAQLYFATNPEKILADEAL
ncbi:MAG: tyrosine-protein phosphatase [Thermoanaerobaculia bacterium]